MFSNRAAKSMNARPGMVLPGDPKVRLLVQQIAQNKTVLQPEVIVEVNSDRGTIELRCQCATKPIAGLVAMAVSQVEEPASVSEAQAVGATPDRLNLQQIVGLIKSDLGEPMQAVLSQDALITASFGSSMHTLRDRLDRLSDLVNVFGEDVLIGDERLMLPAMVREVCQALTPAVQDRYVRFVLEGDKQDLPPVYGSGKLIRRALVECLTNAISHSSGSTDGTQTSAIKVNFYLSGQHLMITVTNLGVLSAQALNRHAAAIFQPTSPSGDTLADADSEALKLQIGLPLTHRILELHGGRLRMEDDAGELEVKLELPTGAPLKNNPHLDLLQAHIYAEDLSTLLARSRGLIRNAAT